MSANVTSVGRESRVTSPVAAMGTVSARKDTASATSAGVRVEYLILTGS